MKLVDELAQRDKEKRERIRIANMVKRKPELEKVCCICGNSAEILHNKKNPYLIAFICRTCREDAEKLKLAESKRFDLREFVDKSKLSSKNFTIRDVTNIVDAFFSDDVSIGTYCEKVGLSRYQFNKLLERYLEYHGSRITEERIKHHTNTTNKKHLYKVLLHK